MMWVLLGMAVGLLPQPGVHQPVPHPFAEGFDATAPPSLPPGWQSSTVRDPDGDFTISVSGANSPAGCALGSNAVVVQWLTSPPVDIGEWRECVLRWMERRSSTHDASLSLELSTDGGTSFLPVEGGVLPPPGVTSYVQRQIALPGWLEGQPAVTFRWSVGGDGTGATGTIRLDDIALSGRPRRDVAVPSFIVAPERPLAGDEVLCRGFAVNTGFDGASGVRLGWSFGAEGGGASNVVQGWIDVGSIPAGDSAAYEFSFVRAGTGPFTIFVFLASGPDLVGTNDTAAFRFGAAIAPASIVINEIMYDPLPEHPEYVELLNRSGDTIDLRAWRLTDDEDDSTGGGLGDDSILLGPGEYLLCSPDTSAPSGYPGLPDSVRLIRGLRGFTLNNSGDLLILSDESDGTIDRLDYLPEWHTPVVEETQGRSLERIESGTPGSGPWNWGTSAGGSGGTPGYRNSLSADDVVRDEKLSCTPNPFSPDGDGVEDATVIAYRLGGDPVMARVRIYDREGRPVRTITDGAFVPGTGSFAWNGFDDDGRKAPIGVYVILLEAVDAAGVEAVSVRGVVVVAGRL